MIRVWVDDVREPPDRVGCEEDYQWAKDYDRAIYLLTHQQVDIIALDHDLGEGQRTGYDIACWIEDQVMNHGMKAPQIFSQSQNPEGRRKILVIAERLRTHERSLRT